jgi:hypothetical protein
LDVRKLIALQEAELKILQDKMKTAEATAKSKAEEKTNKEETKNK